MTKEKVMDELQINIDNIKKTYLETGEYPRDDIERIIVEAEILINKIRFEGWR